MAVSLMAHVPDDAVIGRVVDVVEGDGQLSHTEARSQVARVHRQLFDNVLPKLVTNPR
jgi:hypothetical protein